MLRWFSTFRRRMILYAAALLVMIGGVLWHTRWWPEQVVLSDHYRVLSSTDEATSRDASAAAEALFDAYAAFMDVPRSELEGNRLPLVLHPTRDEFERVHPYSLWAEAFCIPPASFQYVDDDSGSRFHWLFHEGTHQLNYRRYGTNLPRWANEGLACLFGTSRFDGEVLHVGETVTETYPAWWFRRLDPSGDIETDVDREVIIRLEDIVADHKPLRMGEHFNTYYIHWFSLTHHLVLGEGGALREGFLTCLEAGCTPEEFERSVGPVPEVEKNWYEGLRQGRYTGIGATGHGGRRAGE